MFENLHEIFSTKSSPNFACLDQGWETFFVFRVTRIALGCGRPQKLVHFKVHSKMLTLHIILFLTEKTFNEIADESSLFGGVF